VASELKEGLCRWHALVTDDASCAFRFINQRDHHSVGLHWTHFATIAEIVIMIPILKRILGSNTTLIRCIDVWPEGGGDFQGSGGDGRSSTMNNRAEDILR
jgi:hypothetical protein